jgi:hypothetical protein
LYPAAALAFLTLAPLFHEASLFACIIVAFLVMVSLPARTSSRPRHAVWFLVPLPLWLGLWFLVSRSYPAYRGVEASIVNAPVYLIRYIGFMVLPLQRSAIIDANPIRDLVIEAGRYVQLIMGSIVMVILLYLALRSRSAFRVLSVWCLLALVPFTFVQLPERWLELRYLYTASIPFCGLAAMALFALWGQKRVLWKITAGAVILGVTVGSIVLQLMLEKRYDRITSTRPSSSCRPTYPA